MNKLGLVLAVAIGLGWSLNATAAERRNAPEGETPASGKAAAIVIDDFGNGMDGTEQMMNLPFPITVAVMPFLPTTEKDAEEAYYKGHEVIVHMPMEPFTGRKSWLGPGAVTCDLTDEQIRERVRAAIDNVPHAVGISNHMGSKATSSERVMENVLAVCRERGLYFLDSHTNYRSVVGKTARRMGVQSTDNQLFLDDVKDSALIRKQLQLFGKLVEEQGTGIAIGHVGTGGQKTAEAVKEAPQVMPGVRFLRMSEMLKMRGLEN
ncbi:divergent polysaccharide deacetylase family protein [Gorillibacterium timonense]|uniref:divergent polysaccharide deacetylase family protein n=1 Tax=Gorillibacterium timonense TaxID=1689269 RepID=UPI00071D4AA1|nr:divergent polysaccharide deacetylase family protein [Gorillibacterium timonense]